jgi:hypothetical protein
VFANSEFKVIPKMHRIKQLQLSGLFLAKVMGLQGFFEVSAINQKGLKMSA